jgi:hypothetical protein
MRHIRVGDAELAYEVRGEGEPVLLIAPGEFIDGLAHPLFRRPELCSNCGLIHNRQLGVRFAPPGGDPPSFATAFVTRRHTEHVATVAVLRTASPFAQRRRLGRSDDAARTVYHGRVRDRTKSGHQ